MEEIWHFSKIMINREYAKQCVGDGWASLIDAIFNKLPNDAQILQVKEKYGGLRFYVDNVDDDMLDFIAEMEMKSYKICEVCGKPGEAREGGWIKTLCDDHARKDSK